MLTGNKGEWSEIYTLFKVLSDQNLYGGDVDYNKVEKLIYPIIKIIRNEASGDFEYELSGDIVIISGGLEQIRFPIQTFTEQAGILLTKIKESNGSFSSPETEEFMSAIKCKSLKAKSTSKTDINIEIYDKRINQTAQLGFSIKSQLGGDSTLLNAGKTTNFIFRIDNFKGNAQDIKRINEISSTSKIKDRLLEIQNLDGNLVFVGSENSMFNHNMILIDSLMPNLISEVIKQFYLTKMNTVKSLVESIAILNPLNYDIQHSHTFYEFKVKKFLTDVALGMMPSKIWTGVYDASGGYLVVKSDGEVVCYHIYNRNIFEDYLYHNTRLETASSSRHGFGKIYNEHGELYIKLNLQIRFS